MSIDELIDLVSDLRSYGWQGVRRSISGKGSALIKPSAASGQTSHISKSVAAQKLWNAPTREVGHRACLGKLARTPIYGLGSIQNSAEESAAALAAHLS